MQKILSGSQYNDELRRLGINILSGEGCKMGKRWDTDVSPQALPHLEAWLGGVRLTHSGMNGWAVDPKGVYHPGRSQAWDYESGKLREGWYTEDGHCFKLARSMMVDLLKWLILRSGEVAGIIHYVPYHVPNERAYIQEGMYIFETESEMVDFYNQVSSYVEEGAPEGDFRDPAYWLAHFTWKEKIMDFYIHSASDAGANRHEFSGRTIA